MDGLVLQSLKDVAYAAIYTRDQSLFSIRLADRGVILVGRRGDAHAAPDMRFSWSGILVLRDPSGCITCQTIANRAQLMLLEYVERFVFRALISC